MMKPKIVRMVHRNILYSVDLEICREQIRFGGKANMDVFENGVWKSENCGFSGKTWVCWLVSKCKNTLKYILDSSATIPTQFSYIK